ncbi:MAG: hypothetical protein AB7I38_03250 [Dehalococcoidia bacterium]
MTANAPDELQSKLNSVYEEAAAAIDRQDWTHAFELFRAAYDLLASNQPPSLRFHKGLPLYNMGVMSLAAGQIEGVESGNLILSAFLEDVITFADVGGADDPLDQPAAKMLVFGLSVPGTALLSLRDEVVKLVRAGRLFQEPDSLARVLSVEKLFTDEKGASPGSKRKVGQFTTPWQRRVFIGGGYATERMVINQIAEICRTLGFDPVVEFEFEIPVDQIHHHALMLLHECKWAIFEVSAVAGQLMELERTRDYQIDPLVLYQGTDDHGSIPTAMVASLLTRLRINPEHYDRPEELTRHVTAYLDRALASESS